MIKNFYHLRAAILLLALFNVYAVEAQKPERQIREVTILYTNDFHSAFDPIPAYWLKGAPRLGGAAYLSTYIKQIRKHEPTTFLFDTGDMFTGQLSFLTKGEALMEMMMSMKYDAMCIGNHEFDYGSDNFEKQMNRVPFPVLGANIFYQGTTHRYARPYTILEKNGVRLGVIGIIGEDARSVALPSGITHLNFLDPLPIVRELVKELKPQVDLIVVLAHQGKTGPMQTDAENRPEVQRDFDEDRWLCGEVEGIDVFVGGHAHHGIETPYIHPKTGTLIVQTYGYGTRLGYLKLKVKGKKIVWHQGELLKVWSAKFAPDREVAAKLARYKEQVAPQIGQVMGRLQTRLVRDYNRESTLGDFVADVIRAESGAEVGMTNAGGLRGDLPAGKVTNGNVLDALPFINSLVVCEMTGAQIKEVLEQGFSLERGLIQVSGLKAIYDLSQPVKQRLIEAQINGEPLDDRRVYRVATNSFLAQGGDLYHTFLQTKQTDVGGLLSEIVMKYLRQHGEIQAPKMGRLLPLDSGNRGKGYTLRRVEVIGNETVKDNLVFKTIGLNPATLYHPSDIDGCINRLNRFGRFERVTKDNFEIVFDDQERFVDITVHLREKPHLRIRTR
ncbi:MAG: 5'-nucleotidase C-terminal domain-containing protein [Acidobacteria bacterium]|nr:5'-nucleotidase C-terminal domain-containing protein [Acidobacteriota bacterium]